MRENNFEEEHQSVLAVKSIASFMIRKIYKVPYSDDLDSDGEVDY